MPTLGGVFAALGGLVGTAARKIGSGFRQVTGAVNPDVWAELAAVSMSSYSIFLPRREKIVDRGDDGYAPVVLVHGLGGNRGTWLPMRTFLRLHGHRRIYAFGYEKGSIEGQAENLKGFIEQVKQVTGRRKVDIVAHSLGGIIARFTIQRLGLADSVGTLITLATPHQGTYAAQYANTPLTLPLRPDSALIRDLNRDDFGRLPIRFVTVFSDRDIYVLPHEGQTHPDAEEIFIPGISHSQYLLSTRVFRVVAEQLKPGICLLPSA